MRKVIDIEIVYEDWDIGGGTRPKIIKEQSLRLEYSDLDLLWIRYSELVYERKILKEMNERYAESSEVDKLIDTLYKIKIVNQQVEAAKLEYDLLLKLLWDNEDGIDI